MATRLRLTGGLATFAENLLAGKAALDAWLNTPKVSNFLRTHLVDDGEKVNDISPLRKHLSSQTNKSISWHTIEPKPKVLGKIPPKRAFAKTRPQLSIWAREKLREIADNPKKSLKVVAAEIQCSPRALYDAINGKGGPMTIRRILRKFPRLSEPA